MTTTGPQTYNASGTIAINSAYESTVSGDIIYGGDVLLQDDLLVTVNDGDVVFGGTIDGDHDVVVNVGTGNITFGSDIGIGTPPTYLEAITGEMGTIEFNSIINVNGDVVISASYDIENIPGAATTV